MLLDKIINFSAYLFQLVRQILVLHLQFLYSIILLPLIFNEHSILTRTRYLWSLSLSSLFGWRFGSDRARCIIYFFLFNNINLLFFLLNDLLKIQNSFVKCTRLINFFFFLIIIWILMKKTSGILGDRSLIRSHDDCSGVVLLLQYRWWSWYGW